MKKTILTVLQVLVTLGFLVYLFHNPVKRANIIHSLEGLKTGEQWMWITGGILCYGVVELLALTRLQILMRVQGVRISSWRLGSLLMIGIFFNQFMPGGTGGDVVKIYYMLKETPGKMKEALLAALVDRIAGLLGLVCVAGVLITWKWDWITQGQPLPHFETGWLLSLGAMRSWVAQVPGTTRLLYLLLAVLGASLLGIVTSFVVTGFGLVHKLPVRFPGRDVFVDLSVAYNAYMKAIGSFIAAIVLSFGIHIFSFGVFFCAARSLLLAVRFWDFSAIMPIVNTLASLPTSVGGTGPREAMFQTLLSELFQSKDGQAVAISLTGFVMVLFWGLVGGVVYAFYRPSEHAKLREVTRRVHELEHEIAEQEEGSEPGARK